MNLPCPRLVIALLAPATLAALACVATPAAAQGANPPAGLLLMPDTLLRATALATDAARAIAPKGARVLALPGAPDPRLSLAPCARIEPYLAAGVPAWGRTRIGLRCTEGAVRWNVFLPMTVQVWAPALVSRGALPAGAKLIEAQLAFADTDWAAASQPPLVGEDGASVGQPAGAALLAGRTLARAVAPGQALRAADLQSRQWFAAGDVVQVVVAGSGFAIGTEGTAMTPGVEGQQARVRVGASRVVSGRAVGERRLEIAL